MSVYCAIVHFVFFLFLGNKINQDVGGVGNIKTKVLTYRPCVSELWKGCELDTVSRDFVLMDPHPHHPQWGRRDLILRPKTKQHGNKAP